MSTTATFFPALARWVTTPRPSTSVSERHPTNKTRHRKHTLDFGVERRNITLRVGALARDDLRHQHRRTRPLGRHHIHQLAQPLVRRLPAVRVAVVRSGVQEDGAGSPAYVGDCAGDLVDRPAWVAFVVFVRERAAAHAADVVYFGAGGCQAGEERGAVGVAGGRADAVLDVGFSVCVFRLFRQCRWGLVYTTYGDAVS